MIRKWTAMPAAAVLVLLLTGAAVGAQEHTEPANDETAAWAQIVARFLSLIERQADRIDDLREALDRIEDRFDDDEDHDHEDGNGEDHDHDEGDRENESSDHSGK